MAGFFIEALQLSLRPMRKMLKLFMLLLLLLVIIVAWKVFGPTANMPSNKYFYVQTGSTFSTVRDELLSEKILNGSFWFEQVSKVLHYDKSVKPGRYKVTDGMSLWTLIRTLKSGKQAPVNLVITRLRTREDLARKIGENFEPDSISMISFLNNSDSLAHYQLDTNTVMTALIPNTYTLLWNTTPSRIFRKFYSEMMKFWTAKRVEEAANLHLTQKQVYTLASIVEEETNMLQDKGKIASVYLNRINAGMNLAADPTVKFALKNFGLRRIMNSHTRVQSPYNTYVVKGLPPGPICTPSIKTLDAVLNAPATNFLYFVAKPDRSGYSNFAVSYDEHRKNAVIYQHWLDSLFTAKNLNRDGSHLNN